MQVRIRKPRLAAAGLFVLAGIGLGSLLSPLVGSALATVGSTVNLSDHSASAYFAKVDSSGALKTTAAVSGKVAPAAPPLPWSTSTNISGFAAPGQPIAGPTTGTINLTSLSLSTNAASGNGLDVILYHVGVPTSATDCSVPSNLALIWRIRDLGDGTTPLSFSFPTPLQVKSSSGFKACLFAFTTATDLTTVNAVGFYG